MTPLDAQIGMLVKFILGLIVGGIALGIYNLLRKKFFPDSDRAVSVFLSFFIYGFAFLETIVTLCFMWLPFLFRIKKVGLRQAGLDYLLKTLPIAIIVVTIMAFLGLLQNQR